MGLGLGALQAKASTIVETAAQAGQFNTLMKAIEAAGLVDTLKGDGPFTVFAPSDEAFAKLPQERLDALLADKDALTKVLTYHVVPGKVMSSEVQAGEVQTKAGQALVVKTEDGVKVNESRVVTADISASNGVIHVIDSVLLPN
ncbi:MAG TPA: fasciclin domain-containing protein [Hydrogenophaga sp.]|uniref:fasciclin domain-containing protein n=1 Tax=Hydrogenophaga sp. TaxID=1904254 RepID=UPI002C1D64B0|nr:fasciclin domain-containing protein [Hydrogenophaga sp.]HMN94081.1 fasciclin domain-containing protein [Hydrogenophaga sp.]HMP09895.1 fasciclin domain-containing protein [Hydrogenophaga sp.]